MDLAGRACGIDGYRIGAGYPVFMTGLSILRICTRGAIAPEDGMALSVCQIHIETKVESQIVGIADFLLIGV